MHMTGGYSVSDIAQTHGPVTNTVTIVTLQRDIA